TMKRRTQRGFTLVELLVAVTIMLALSMVSFPIISLKVRMERERDLRDDLHILRVALDRYKDGCEQGWFGPPKNGSDCYPESLESLVEGIKLAQSPDGKKVKFLRSIPRDPFTGKYEWGLRSTQDDPKNKSWGGQNIFDVYTKTEIKAANGTPY